MRLLICAGGTGGGVYPALAVYEALTSQRPNVETLWVGGEGGMEEDLVKRAGIPFCSIPAAGVHGVGLRALPGNLAKLARGVTASRRVLREFKPDVLLFTGGYIAAPMALAGRKTPIALYVPDIEPGLALKFLARFADVVTLTAEDSKKYFPGSNRFHVTGYPLRSGLSTWSRETALAHLGLDPAKPVLLITGGSKGARSINNAVLNNLTDLLQFTQAIHITGSLDWDQIEKRSQALPAGLKKNYHAMPYLHDMGAALAAADLVLSRAGASTLGEYPLFGLPSILIPYPYAWRYQKVNADHLVTRGAAILLTDNQMGEKLLAVVKELMNNNDKLESMRAASKALAYPNAARAIASRLVELAGEQPL